MTGKSKNPAHPDAHPTAPGGMSRKALIKELIDEHGYVADSDWDGTSWPALIQMVVNERAGNEPDEDEVDGLRHCGGCGAELDADDPHVLCDECTEDEDDPEAEGWTPDDVIEDEIKSEYEDPTPGIFKSAQSMFDDEGNEPEVTEDSNGEALADLINANFAEAMARPLDHEVFENFMVDGDDEDDAVQSIMAAFDGESVSVVEEAIDDLSMDEDGMLDPEALFEEMFAERQKELDTLPPPIFIGIPGVKDYIFDGHAGAGPSGAERWMNCTMSLSASRAFLETLTPNQAREYAKSGAAARQGTTAHAVAEIEANHILGRAEESEVEMTLLELSINPESEGEAYDDEMADYVGEYVDLVRSYAQERGAENVLIESRVEAAIPLTDMHDDEVYVIRGSADLGVKPTKKYKTLVVGDLKYGEGIDVDVESNPQIREYALGLLGQFIDEEGNLTVDIREIEYIIAQPRLGGIKRWSESVDDLLTWRDEVLAPRLTKALYGAAEGATYEPSELACQWCPARGSCPALAASVIEKGAELFDVVQEAEFENGVGSFPETDSLPNDTLGNLLAQANAVEKLRKSLREEAQRRLHRGEVVPGFHLVNYSPNRHWVEFENDDAVSALEDKGLTQTQMAQMFTEPRLVSPTVAEKVLGKEGFPAVADLIVKPDKVPVISTGPNDRRKAWQGKAPEDMFADESNTIGETDE